MLCQPGVVRIASVANPPPEKTSILVVNEGFGTREHTAEMAKLPVNFGSGRSHSHSARCNTGIC